VDVGGIPTPLKNMKVSWGYYSHIYIYIPSRSHSTLTCRKPRAAGDRRCKIRRPKRPRYCGPPADTTKGPAPRCWKGVKKVDFIGENDEKCRFFVVLPARNDEHVGFEWF